MVNFKQFEINVYAAVTKELNQIVAEVLGFEMRLSKSDCISLHQEILKALNRVSEEVMLQILHGVLNFQALELRENQ